MKCRSSYGHRITRITGDCFRLSWSFDTKIAGSRLRWPRTITRDTDEVGALRFAKKWNISMPLHSLLTDQKETRKQ